MTTCSSGRICIAYRHAAGLRPTSCQTSCHRWRGKEELAHGRTCKGNDMSANCRTAIIDLKFRCNITWFLQKKWIGGEGGRGGGGASDFKLRHYCNSTYRRRVKLSRTKAGLKVFRLFKSHPALSAFQKVSERLRTKRSNEFRVLLLLLLLVVE